MDAFKTLILLVLACSSIHFTSALDLYEFQDESFDSMFFGLSGSQFNPLVNEEDADDFDFLNEEDPFASDAFDFTGENAEDGEMSLDDLILPSEETQEILTFVDLINNKNFDMDELFQQHGMLQTVSGFSEEVASALRELRNGEERLDMMITALELRNAINNLENGETETALFEFSNASSGIALGAFDGVDGPEEKGEEDLESRYNINLMENGRFRPENADNSSLNVYLAIGSVAIALVVIAAVVKGVRSLRKHEAALEEEAPSNYLELGN